jgi:hypothetical protein
MSHFERAEWRFLAGLSVAAVLAVHAAAAPVDWPPETRLAAMPEPAARPLHGETSLVLRFIQEEGPDSGHVRVELAPADRSLNPMEARQAAQQGFLEALNEPALEGLSRIVVEVRLVPDRERHMPDRSGLDSGGGPVTGAEDLALKRIYLFLARGGGIWSVMLAE